MEEVYNFIRKEIGLSVGDTIVVGVSGGPDSMALLYILNEFKNKMDLNIICAHVNHNKRKESEQEKIDLESKFKKQVEEPKKVTNVKKDEKIIEEEPDILDELNNLMATSKEDMIDENKPLVKQIDVPNVKTYDDIIEEYENGEEENAVISTEELEKVTRKRMEDLGMNDNQVAIQKYEEEQEKKAIISYEQLLKNASNITLTYKEEKNKKGAPKVNKIEVQEKEVTQAVSYVAEEEYLKILKEFRLSLE